MTRSVTMAWAASLFLTVSLAAPASAQNQSQQQSRDSQSGANTGASANQTGSQQQSAPQSNPNGQPSAQQSANLQLGALFDYVNQQQGSAWSNGDSWFAYSSSPAGMDLAAADDSLREHLKLPKDQGLVVLALDPQSSPAQAGIQLNDVLLLVGDAPVAKPEDLDDRLKQAGDEPVALTVLRGGKRLKWRVQPQLRVTLGPVQAGPPAFWIGVSVTPLGPALRSQLQLSGEKGMAVIDVVKESPAEHAGIKLHDILLSLAGNDLTNQERLVELVQKNGEKPAALELIRAGKTQTIEIAPRRRKPARFTADAKDGDGRSQFYSFVRPGALIPNWTTNPQQWKVDTFDAGNLQLRPVYAWKQGTNDKPTQTTDGKDPVSKRLDNLDNELKQLRKAIEELSKAAKDR
jgi:C-terminal processing protease CtpA/Prc